jgi:single-strand DNA-binding protein
VNGKAINKFSIAVNEKRKSGDEWKDQAGFFEINLWGQLGETLNQFLIKGKQVAVTGKLTQERWEQNGENRQKVVVTAATVQLLGGSSGNGGGFGQDPANRPPAADDGFGDDIPF